MKIKLAWFCEIDKQMYVKSRQGRNQDWYKRPIFLSDLSEKWNGLFLFFCYGLYIRHIDK